MHNDAGRPLVEFMNDDLFSLDYAHYLIQDKTCDIIIYEKNFIDTDDIEITHMDYTLRQICSEIITNGRQLLPYRALSGRKYRCPDRFPKIRILNFRKQWKDHLRREGVVFVPLPSREETVHDTNRFKPCAGGVLVRLFQGMDKILFKIQKKCARINKRFPV